MCVPAGLAKGVLLSSPCIMEVCDALREALRSVGECMVPRSTSSPCESIMVVTTEQNSVGGSLMVVMMGGGLCVKICETKEEIREDFPHPSSPRTRRRMAEGPEVAMGRAAWVGGVF